MALSLVIPNVRKCARKTFIFSSIISVLEDTKPADLHSSEHLPSQIIFPVAYFLKKPTENSWGVEGDEIAMRTLECRAINPYADCKSDAFRRATNSCGILI